MATVEEIYRKNRQFKIFVSKHRRRLVKESRFLYFPGPSRSKFKVHMGSRNKSTSDVTNLTGLGHREFDIHDDAISLTFSTSSSPGLQRRRDYYRHSSLTDEVYRMNYTRGRRHCRSPEFKNQCMSSQFELTSKNLGSASSVSRFFNSVSTGFNRLNSTGSMTSLFSSASSDSSCSFMIPFRTIPPRPVNLTAKAELISHIEKRNTKGYDDVILNEIRDGRIIDSHFERPISETMSKINQLFPVSNGSMGAKF